MLGHFFTTSFFQKLANELEPVPTLSERQLRQALSLPSLEKRLSLSKVRSSLK